MCSDPHQVRRCNLWQGTFLHSTTKLSLAFLLSTLFLTLSIPHLSAPVPAAQAQSGPSLIIDKQVSKHTPAPGEKFTYTIRYRCSSVSENCVDAQVRDEISPYLTVVDYTRKGGNISNVSVGNATYIWDLENVIDKPGELSAGSVGVIQIQVRFPACAAQTPTAGSTLSNTATFSIANGAPVTSAANGADVIVPTISACPEEIVEVKEGFHKTNWDEIFANPGNPRVTYEIFLVNSPTAYVVEDVIPQGLTLESIQLSNLILSGGHVDLRCSGTWYDLSSTLDDRLNVPSDVHPDCAATQAYATDFAYWFTDAEALRFHVPANYVADRENPLHLVFMLDSNYPVGGIIRNSAVLTEPVDADLNGNAVTGEVLIRSVDKEVVEPSLMGSIEVDSFILPGYLNGEGISILDGNKNLPNFVENENSTNHVNLNLSTVYLAQNDMVWALRSQLRNDTSLNHHWVNPVLIVDLPAEAAFVQDPAIGNFVQVGIPNRSTITSDYDPYNNSNCSAPKVSVIERYNNTERTRLRLDFPGCTIYGGLQQYTGIALYVSGRLKPGVPLNTTLRTDFRMYDENGLMFRCFGNDTVYKNWCGTRNTINVSGFPPRSFTTLEAHLFAKGSLDAEYHRYPQTGHSDLSGQVDYEAYVINTGNVVHRHVDLVNVLPHFDDTSLTTALQRDSSWEQEYRSRVTLERLDITTGNWTPVPEGEITRGPFYSSSTIPCILSASGAEIQVDDTLAVLPSGCDANPWEAPIADPQGMRSAALRWVPVTGFGPNEEIRVKIAAQQAILNDTCAVFTDDFGSGRARADLVPSTGTAFSFDPAGSVDPGSYALVPALLGEKDINGNEWHDVAADLTSGDDAGRMLVVNASGIGGEIYRKSASDLVVGAHYALTVWVMNAQEDPAAQPPSLQMAVEPEGGGIPFNSLVTDPTAVEDALVWSAYTIGFTAPASKVDIVLSAVE